MARWQLQEAKARFSELIRDCIKEPQIVSKSGKDEAVVISLAAYQKLRGQEKHLIEFLENSPFKGVTLELERDKSAVREIDL